MPIADMICGNIFMVVLAGQGGTKIWLASPGFTGQQDLIIMGLTDQEMGRVQFGSYPHTCSSNFGINLVLGPS